MEAQWAEKPLAPLALPRRRSNSQARALLTPALRGLDIALPKRRDAANPVLDDVSPIGEYDRLADNYAHVLRRERDKRRFPHEVVSNDADASDVKTERPRVVADDAEDRTKVRREESDGDVVARPRKRTIQVVVRKRPLRQGESGEDIVAVTPPAVQLNAQKQRLDLSEYTDSHEFAFDNTFGETHTNQHIYQACAQPLIDTVFEGGSASCFAYGQTGSGKTHTMLGVEGEHGLCMLAAVDIFRRKQPEHRVFVSLFEIYCNSLFDLLNSRFPVVTREDANRKVNLCGLTRHEISSTDDLARIMEVGAAQRRTGSTSANEYSSRSHAVLVLQVRDDSTPKFLGCINVVDLAGSERAADTAGNDKHTRMEGAEINKSLLALKECIRGLDERKKHIPFRGSKLTEVLRDSFVGNSRTLMIATISPSSESQEHTLNTLRYAFRVKGLSIEAIEPSKDRIVPLRPPRAKSVDPPREPPSPPPPRAHRKRRSRRGVAVADDGGGGGGGGAGRAALSPERKSSPSSGTAERTPRRRVVGFDHLERFRDDVRVEMDRLRNEMSEMMKQKDEVIAKLKDREADLERQVEMIRRLVHARAPVKTIDLDEEL